MPPDSYTGLLDGSAPSIDTAAPYADEFSHMILQASGIDHRSDAWAVKNLRSIISGGMRLADAISITAAAMISYRLSQGTPLPSSLYISEMIIGVLLAVIYFDRANLYNLSQPNQLRLNLHKLALTLSAVAATVIILDYLLKISDQISRAWTVIWFLVSLVLLAAVRVLARRVVSKLDHAGKLATPIAIVGSRDSNRRLLAQISAEIGKTVCLAGVFNVDADTPAAFDRLALMSRTRHIDEVLVSLPWTNPAPLESLLRPLRNLPMVVKLVPEIPNTGFSCLSFSDQCGMPAISVIERPLSDVQIAIKRAEDIVLSAIALAALAPLMLLIAALVKLESPGSALFRQQRWGFNAKQISVLKFRTMRVQTVEDPMVTQATRDDPRVTRLGRFLRRTSLDELPQIINVLRGDMSLVGPRPHAVAHNERYMALIDDYLGRHRVKPGITGLAQVNGCRGITDTLDKMEARVAYDLRYIDEWSLILDFKIMVSTVFVGFINKNAF